MAKDNLNWRDINEDYIIEQVSWIVEEYSMLKFQDIY